MMARPRSHRPSARKSSHSTLVFAVLIMFTFVILILLAFGILSVPSNNAGSSKANDLTSIVRKTLQRYYTILIDSLFYLNWVSFKIELYYNFRRSGEDDSKNERWVEIISWEPRASIYHNFLVSLSIYKILVVPFLCKSVLASYISLPFSSSLICIFNVYFPVYILIH